MDDFSITDERLAEALEGLRRINRWLGGYAALRTALGPLVQKARARPGCRPLRLLDLGTGAADAPEHLVRWADAQGVRLEVAGVDANPATVAYARAALDRRLPPHLRGRVRVETADALALPYADDAFDAVLASLFLHHFDGEAAVALLREMQRVGRRGLVVNDLHRHVLAYYGIRALTAVLPTPEMVRHDAPLSVRRGFRRAELVALAEQAGLEAAAVRWRWAFRWVLSTLPRL